jgi:FKBP-type peptidyl-prolyl cis-trans isomerase (trigger factor)
MDFSMVRTCSFVSDAAGLVAFHGCGWEPALRWAKRSLAGFVAWLVLWGLTGCANSDGPGADFLVRIGDHVLTTTEFNQDFEIVKAAYPSNLRQNSEELQEAQLRLLNQLVDELVLVVKAQELGIQVSDEELNQAVAEIKQDYPDDLFQQTLLEQAVSYDAWEKRLKTRLLIDKVIDRDLKEKIVISADDIATYYEQHYKKQSPQGDSVKNPEVESNINEFIIRALRRKKAEEAYKDWITGLKKKYHIEINRRQWEKISGSKTLPPEVFEAE